MWRWTPGRVAWALDSYRVICEVLRGPASAYNPGLPPQRAAETEARLLHLAEVRADVELAVAGLVPTRRAAALYWLYPYVLTLRDLAILIDRPYWQARELMHLAYWDVVRRLCWGEGPQELTRADWPGVDARAVAAVDVWLICSDAAHRAVVQWVERRLRTVPRRRKRRRP